MAEVEKNMKVNFSNASDESLIVNTKVFGGKSGPILNWRALSPLGEKAKQYADNLREEMDHDE